MTRLNFVKKARKDYPGIVKGEPYYWWKFKFGPKRRSKTRPRRSQLTQSDFLATVWDLEDDFSLGDDPRGSIEELTSELENLKDECQEKIDNMPEQLQESDSGTILQERIENLEEWISELEGIDVDIDEELSDEEKKERREEVESEVNETFGKF